MGWSSDCGVETAALSLRKQRPPKRSARGCCRLRASVRDRRRPDRAMHCFAGSKQLIAKVEALLRPREPDLHAPLLSAQDFRLLGHIAPLLRIPDTSSAIRHLTRSAMRANLGLVPARFRLFAHIGLPDARPGPSLGH
jgi:hypothetical protein